MYAAGMLVVIALWLWASPFTRRKPRVDGLVESPAEFSLEQLNALASKNRSLSITAFRVGRVSRSGAVFPCPRCLNR